MAEKDVIDWPPQGIGQQNVEEGVYRRFTEAVVSTVEEEMMQRYKKKRSCARSLKTHTIIH